MIKRIVLKRLTVLTAIVVAVILAVWLSTGRPATADPARQATPGPTPQFEKGDVFAAVGDPYVYWYRLSATRVLTLETRQPGPYNAGMAFDTAGNLYVTDFSALTVSKFNTSGDLQDTFGDYSCNPESIVFDCAGNAYVGTVFGDNDIRKFDTEGNLLAPFDVRPERNGSDWIDLAADQCTMFYTSEGKKIMRFDVCNNGQLSDFASDLPGSRAFELRILPDGGVLVADTEAIYRLDSTGTRTITYTHPNETHWRNLSLAPDGSSFWAGDRVSGRFYRFDITTGDVLTGPISTTRPDLLRGLDVFCEPRAASCNCADLRVTQADSPDPVTVGNTLTYTIIVANDGPTPAMGVTLTETLPSGVTFVSATDTRCAEAGGIVTCTFGYMASGDSVTIGIMVTPVARGTITCMATVVSNAFDPDPTNNLAIEDTAVTGEDSPVGDEEGGPAIPEPATLTLLGLGLAGLVGYIRHQRQASKKSTAG